MFKIYRFNIKQKLKVKSLSFIKSLKHERKKRERFKGIGIFAWNNMCSPNILCINIIKTISGIINVYG